MLGKKNIFYFLDVKQYYVIFYYALKIRCKNFSEQYIMTYTQLQFLIYFYCTHFDKTLPTMDFTLINIEKNGYGSLKCLNV